MVMFVTKILPVSRSSNLEMALVSVTKDAKCYFAVTTGWGGGSYSRGEENFCILKFPKLNFQLKIVVGSYSSS